VPVGRATLQAAISGSSACPWAPAGPPDVGKSPGVAVIDHRQLVTDRWLPFCLPVASPVTINFCLICAGSIDVMQIR
jgi:hypothetical protein